MAGQKGYTLKGKYLTRVSQADYAVQYGKTFPLRSRPDLCYFQLSAIRVRSSKIHETEKSCSRHRSVDWHCGSHLWAGDPEPGAVARDRPPEAADEFADGGFHESEPGGGARVLLSSGGNARHQYHSAGAV